MEADLDVSLQSFVRKRQVFSELSNWTWREVTVSQDPVKMFD